MGTNRYYLVTLCCVVALAGVGFSVLILGVAVPVRATSADVAVNVSITEKGFDPAEVNVDLGATVKWTNDTQQRVRILSNETKCVFLPLIKFDEGGSDVFGAISPGPDSFLPQVSDSWLDEILEPGESFEYTFIAVGEYPYFQAGCSNVKGLVLVMEAGDFTMEIEPDSRNVSQG